MGKYNPAQSFSETACAHTCPPVSTHNSTTEDSALDVITDWRKVQKSWPESTGTAGAGDGGPRARPHGGTGICQTGGHSALPEDPRAACTAVLLVAPKHLFVLVVCY